MTSIEIPESVREIGSVAFSGCSSLTSIIVANNNPVYDSREGCNAIIRTDDNTLIIGCVNTTIPNGVTSIGNDAFGYCSSLESIVIPESVTSIGQRAFNGCSSLESINIPESVTSIEYAVFSGCSSLESIVIPDGVTSIGDYAFYDCVSLTSVEIGNGVRSIGAWAFAYCYNPSLTTVICRAENVPELGGAVFLYVPTSEATLHVPASALEDYKAADQWKDFFRILSLDDRVLDYALREGWNTIVLPWSTDLEPFGEGAKAYAFTGAEDGTLSFSTVDHLEANTPYIIYATEAQDDLVFYNVTDCSFSADPSVEHNSVTFRGTYENIDAPDMQGKYGVADDAHIRRGSELASIKAYHAYFEAAAGAEVKAISFDGDDATGITEIADALQQDAQYYNLAGQRTQKPQKGVNIIGGKKVLY